MQKLITQPHLKNDSNDSTQLKKLLDTTDQILATLRNLDRPVDSWDDWIVITICHKLNDNSRKEWEKRVGHAKTLPTWDELREFLEEEYRIMESLESRHKTRNKEKTTTVRINQASMVNEQCKVCNQDHTLFQCEKFKKMNTDER